MSRLLEFAGEYYRPQSVLLLEETHIYVSRSDVHFWKSGRIGSLVFEGDCILGHEAAGIVLRCGAGVTNVVPGELVIFIVLSS